MGSFVGEWGLYQWFEEHGRHLIHPDDLDGFRGLLPNARVFQCLAYDGEFLTLRYGDLRFRVKPDLFKRLPKPLFSFGQTVTATNGSNLLTGVVSDIVWHFKESKPFFRVSVNGR